MSPQEKLDARLALIVTIIVFCLGILVGCVSSAFACNSFESCMYEARNNSHTKIPLIGSFFAKSYSDQALAYATGDIADALKDLKRDLK